MADSPWQEKCKFCSVFSCGKLKENGRLASFVLKHNSLIIHSLRKDVPRYHCQTAAGQMHDRALKIRGSTWRRTLKQVVLWVLLSLLTTVPLPSNQIHKLFCSHSEGILPQTDTPCGLHGNPLPAELMSALRQLSLFTRTTLQKSLLSAWGAALRPYDSEFLQSFESHVAGGIVSWRQRSC